MPNLALVIRRRRSDVLHFLSTFPSVERRQVTDSVSHRNEGPQSPSKQVGLSKTVLNAGKPRKFPSTGEVGAYWRVVRRLGKANLALLQGGTYKKKPPALLRNAVMCG